ncbi:MAG: hypothetical protein RIN53_04805 [Gammaproteobacteria bacterium]
MQKFKKIESGGFADIYQISESQVLKAYRSQLQAHNPMGNMEDHDLVTQAHFRAEANAYESLQRFEKFKPYLPRFYGIADPCSLLQNQQESGKFVEGCGLLLEFLPGRAVKICNLEQDIKVTAENVLDEISEILENLNVWDSSAFSPGTQSEVTLIDFALWESQEYEEYLFDHKELSQAMRSKLLRENAH